MEKIRSHSRTTNILSLALLVILLCVVLLPTSQAFAGAPKPPKTYIPSSDECKTYQRWGEYFNQFPPNKSYLLTPPKPYDFVAKGQTMYEIQTLYRYNPITDSFVVCTQAETEPQNHVIWVK